MKATQQITKTGHKPCKHLTTIEICKDCGESLGIWRPVTKSPFIPIKHENKRNKKTN